MFQVRELITDKEWKVVKEFKDLHSARMFKNEHKRKTTNPTRIFDAEGKEVV